MIKRVLAALTLLLTSGGLAPAQGDDGCGVLPTCKIPPIQLLYQEPAPPFTEAAPVQLPGVKYFRAAVASPKILDCPPEPPVKYFRGTPPLVTTIVCPPPKVDLFRAEASPPRPPLTWKQPPITVFRATVTGPCEVPSVRLPSVTLLTKPQPPCPVEVACPGK